MHRGQAGTTAHRNGGKVVYATWLAAARAAKNMSNIHRMQEDPPAFDFYSCTWADRFEDGETADEHWHVGRVPVRTPEIKA
jgi:hypothetical protein